MNTHVINPHIDKMSFSTRESINVLRESVQMSGNNCKVLSVTSAVPNEGKSYIAFCLANSLANLGKKTIYVDCDIRNSIFRKEHEITEEIVGLSEYICGQCSEDNLVYNTTVDNLSVVFSGRKSPKPSELLSDQSFDDLLNSLKETYDYVILDTPPVNLVVDAVIVSKKADATILVVKSFFTERIEAIKMKKQLEMADVKILGVVLNLHDVKKRNYGRYGYGKYGYGYGKYGYGKYGYGYGYGESKKGEKK